MFAQGILQERNTVCGTEKMGITFLKLVGGLGALWAATKMGLEWTGQMNLVRDSVAQSAAWAVKVHAVLSAPSQPSTLLIMSLSVGFFFLLVYVDNRNRRSRIFRLPLSPGSSRHQREQREKDPYSARISSNRPVSPFQLQEEWESLEESDRETVREVVLKGGLMESDITALLKARGFLQDGAAYESIADRVSFIQCDFTGYHSIVPVCRSWLSEKIHEELKDESCSNEIR